MRTGKFKDVCRNSTDLIDRILSKLCSGVAVKIFIERIQQVQHAWGYDSFLHRMIVFVKSGRESEVLPGICFVSRDSMND